MSLGFVITLAISVLSIASHNPMGVSAEKDALHRYQNRKRENEREREREIEIDSRSLKEVSKQNKKLKSPS